MESNPGVSPGLAWPPPSGPTFSSGITSHLSPRLVRVQPTFSSCRTPSSFPPWDLHICCSTPGTLSPQLPTPCHCHLEEKTLMLRCRILRESTPSKVIFQASYSHTLCCFTFSSLLSTQIYYGFISFLYTLILSVSSKHTKP